MTARAPIGVDWRLAVLVSAAGAACLVLLPMVHVLVVALGESTGGMVAGAVVLLLVATVTPQLALLFQGKRPASRAT
jgi:hypothetical protein